MRRLTGLAILAVMVTACGGSAPIAAKSPSPSPVAATSASPSPSPSPSPVQSSPTPSAPPQPSPVPKVACNGGASAGPMLLMQGIYVTTQLLYDVTNPTHPRLLCKIANTSAHLFTGDTFEYLMPVSATETDVMLHSLGSGNESHTGKFPFYVTSGSWLPDQTVMAYSMRSPDAASMQVWLYSQRRTALLYTYRIGMADCPCRFGLPPQVLAVSPDGQYVVAGWAVGKGAEPLAVYRVSDRSRVASLDISVAGAFWDRNGHRLFLSRFGAASQSWTPESGTSALAGAATWSFYPGLSPDGTQAAYTAYSDPDQMQQPRIYLYDLKAATTRTLVDQLRTQAIFIKDGWIWSLEERACLPADQCAGSTIPAGRVFAMDVSTGVEQEIVWGFGNDPHGQGGDFGWGVFGPGEFWPTT